jgi:hypothetical protein
MGMNAIREMVRQRRAELEALEAHRRIASSKPRTSSGAVARPPSLGTALPRRVAWIRQVVPALGEVFDQMAGGVPIDAVMVSVSAAPVRDQTHGYR